MSCSSNPAEQLAQLSWLLAGEPQSATAGFQLLPRALCLPLLEQHRLIATVATMLLADRVQQDNTSNSYADLLSARNQKAWTLLHLYASQANHPWCESNSAFASLMLTVLSSGSMYSRYGAFGAAAVHFLAFHLGLQGQLFAIMSRACSCQSSTACALLQPWPCHSSNGRPTKGCCDYRAAH
jgi:hypothetical protein